MNTTQNFNFPLLHQNQAMKEIIINETINKIDGLLNNSIIAEINVLPESMKNGDLYLFKPQQDGELNKYNDHLALYNNDKWDFISPREGMIFFMKSLNKFLIFKDAQWSGLN